MKEFWDFVSKVKTPINAIALFAMSVQISGNMILPKLTESNQSTYVWFLMIFPIILLVLFFLVLWKKPVNLYAPSDYRDDDTFFKMFGTASASQKLAATIKEAEEDNDTTTDENCPEKRVRSFDDIKRGNVAERGVFEKVSEYLEVENAGIRYLERKYKTSIRRDIVFYNDTNAAVEATWDGCFLEGELRYFIEVKYYRKIRNLKHVYDQVISRALSPAFDVIRPYVRIIILIVTTGDEVENFKRIVDRFDKKHNIQVEFEVVDVANIRNQ